VGPSPRRRGERWNAKERKQGGDKKEQIMKKGGK